MIEQLKRMAREEQQALTALEHIERPTNSDRDRESAHRANIAALQWAIKQIEAGSQVRGQKSAALCRDAATGGNRKS